MLIKSYQRTMPAPYMYHMAGDGPVAQEANSPCASISEESQSSFVSRNFDHYKEPTVLDIPEVLNGIQTALDCGDVETLARLVHSHGLPPYLRAEAWPLLLRSHPAVLKAFGELKSKDTHIFEEKWIKRLRGDLRRMERARGVTLNSSLIEQVVTQFLKTWGWKIPYETPMIWVMDFLICGKQSFNSPGGSPGESVASSIASSPSRSNFEVEAFSRSTTSLASTTSFGFSGVPLHLLEEVFTNVMLVMSDEPTPYSEFISMIRLALPILSEYFQCEGILSAANSGDVWLVWWLRWFGIRAFPSTLLERLWDEYFSFRPSGITDNHQAKEETSSSTGKDVLDIFLSRESINRCHLLKCVVLMKVYMSKLLELDTSECRQFLMHLPECEDVEAVISESIKLGVRYDELE